MLSGQVRLIVFTKKKKCTKSQVLLSTSSNIFVHVSESESESEMYLFNPYKKCIQSNNETILGQGTPITTSLVANIGAAYYIINKKSYHKLKIHNKVIHDHTRMSL